MTRTTSTPHPACHHPVEIAEVMAGRKRRSVVVTALVASLVAIIGSIVAIGLWAGSLESDVGHIHEDCTDNEEELKVHRRDLRRIDERRGEEYKEILRVTVRTEAAVEDIGERVGRVEQKIDAANGHNRRRRR